MADNNLKESKEELSRLHKEMKEMEPGTKDYQAVMEQYIALNEIILRHMAQNDSSYAVANSADSKAEELVLREKELVLREKELKQQFWSDISSDVIGAAVLGLVSHGEQVNVLGRGLMNFGRNQYDKITKKK